MGRRSDNSNASALKELLKKHTPLEIENAIIKVFLDRNRKTIQTQNVLLQEALNNANKDLVSIIERKFGITLAKPDLKTIEYLFEHLFSETEKSESGIQYTPNFIIQFIVDTTINSYGFVCDPSCGSGGFLIEAAKKLSTISGKEIADIIETCIYGCDISPDAVRRTKLMLSLLCAIERCDRFKINFKIFCDDSLLLNWKERFPEVFSKGGFDAVVGNPPYVKVQNMDKVSRTIIPKRWSTVSGGSHNLYIPFIQLGAELLNTDGTLGYIVSSMYFKSIASKSLRSYLQRNRLVSKIIDFGDLQVFNQRQTYTCLTFIDKKPKDHLKYALLDDVQELYNLNFSEVSYDTLNPRKWRLLSKKDYDNIVKIESANTKLGIMTNISTGIATLKDALYFVDSSRKENGYYFKSYKGKEYLIEEQITKEIVKVSDFSSREELEKNTRRIIFPYSKVKPPTLISEHELAELYPKTYEYLLDIKVELAKRDKGTRQYEAWFAYGRSQGLAYLDEKLLTPTFSDKPRFLLCNKKEVLFCNGYAVMPKTPGQTRIDGSFDSDARQLELLAKILNSCVMDYYIRKTSYVIEGGFYCYQKQFIESFSVPKLSEDEKQRLLEEKDPKIIDSFLVRKYGLEL